jgi:hypothetical protein
MSAVKQGDFNGISSQDRFESINGVIGIKDEVKKVLRQPGYDDGSAGPVFVR